MDNKKKFKDWAIEQGTKAVMEQHKLPAGAAERAMRAGLLQVQQYINGLDGRPAEAEITQERFARFIASPQWEQFKTKMAKMMAAKAPGLAQQISAKAVGQR